MPTLTIDNIPVEVANGATILDAAKKAGIRVPTLCYLEGVQAVGACRVCLVEVEGAKTLVASCVMPAADGMKVLTSSKRVRDARRMVVALAPYVARGIPVVGLEPSCLFGLRDEFLSMLPDETTGTLAMNALVFEEFLAREADAGRLALKLKPLAEKKALLHGHCHQKAFAAMGAVERALALVPGLVVETIESSCCGMAGAFGYDAKHFDVSMKMAEASLLPKVRAAEPGTLIVADGTSCRHQIRDGAGREALHVARVLEKALA